MSRLQRHYSQARQKSNSKLLAKTGQKIQNLHLWSVWVSWNYEKVCGSYSRLEQVRHAELWKKRKFKLSVKMDKNWKSFWKTLFQNLYVGTMFWATRSSRLSFMELLYEGLIRKLFIILKSLSNRLTCSTSMSTWKMRMDIVTAVSPSATFVVDETKIGQHSS